MHGRDRDESRLVGHRRRHGEPDKQAKRAEQPDRDRQGEFNTQINKIRYIIEQAIANFKTWRIMHTDYRRPLATLPQTISAAVALHFYAVA